MPHPFDGVGVQVARLRQPLGHHAHLMRSSCGGHWGVMPI